jgi:hypothetical protein
MSNRQRRRPDNDNFRQRDPTRWAILILAALAIVFALALIIRYL